MTMNPEEMEKKILILERDLEILSNLMGRLNENFDDTVDRMIFLYEIIKPTNYHQSEYGLN